MKDLREKCPALFSVLKHTKMAEELLSRALGESLSPAAYLQDVVNAQRGALIQARKAIEVCTNEIKRIEGIVEKTNVVCLVNDGRTPESLPGSRNHHPRKLR